MLDYFDLCHPFYIRVILCWGWIGVEKAGSYHMTRSRSFVTKHRIADAAHHRSLGGILAGDAFFVCAFLFFFFLHTVDFIAEGYLEVHLNFLWSTLHLAYKVVK